MNNLREEKDTVRLDAYKYFKVSFSLFTLNRAKQHSVTLHRSSDVAILCTKK